MEISKHVYYSILQGLLYHLLCGLDFRGAIRRALPLSVKVQTVQRASLVSVDNTICIEHGNNLEYEVIPQEFSLEAALLQEELNSALHHVRTYSLARVRSGCEYYRLSLCDFALRAVEICNYKLGAPVACHALAQDAPSDKVTILLGANLLIKKIKQIGVSVRVAVRNINKLRGVIENDFEGESGLAATPIGFRKVILEVLNVDAISVPADSARLCQRRRVEHGTHSRLVQTVLVLEVVDVKSVFLAHDYI